MVDKDLILAKASSVKRHMKRVNNKVNTDLQTFLKEPDRQDIVLFNLQMAIQNCIDIASHIISEEGFGVPGSTSDMFFSLEENGYLDTDMTNKIVKAVGFRNLIVHEYTKIDLEQVYEVARRDISDFDEYLKSIFKNLNLGD